MKKMVSSCKTLRAWLVLINANVSGFIQLYTLFTRFNIIQKYITSYHMLISLYIFLLLISSTCVSDVYGFIWHIICIMFIGQNSNVTMLLVQHRVIRNGPLYVISYLSAELLGNMTLSLNLLFWSTFVLF